MELYKYWETFLGVHLLYVRVFKAAKDTFILYWKRKDNRMIKANLIFMKEVNVSHLDQCQTNR